MSSFIYKNSYYYYFSFLFIWVVFLCFRYGNSTFIWKWIRVAIAWISMKNIANISFILERLKYLLWQKSKFNILQYQMVQSPIFRLLLNNDVINLAIHFVVHDNMESNVVFYVALENNKENIINFIDIITKLWSDN